jgi:hypothetical protein
VAAVRDVASIADSEHGWLYFIQQGQGGGPFKIGRAKNPRKRLAELQTGNPTPLRLVAAVVDAAVFEPQVHMALAEARIGDSEWFEAEPVWEFLELLWADLSPIEVSEVVPEVLA